MLQYNKQYEGNYINIRIPLSLWQSIQTILTNVNESDIQEINYDKEREEFRQFMNTIYL